MVVVNPAVEHGNDNLLAAGGCRPRLHRADICAFLATVLPVVCQSPLFTKFWIIRVQMFQATTCMIEAYFVVLLCVLDLRQSSIFSGNRLGISIVQIIDYLQARHSLDLVCDLIV